MDQLTTLVEYLPESTVPLVALFGLIALSLMAYVGHLLAQDSRRTRENIELARLRAKLPDAVGRHALGWARGTDTQRTLWDCPTQVWHLEDFRDAENALAGAR